MADALPARVNVSLAKSVAGSEQMRFAIQQAWVKIEKRLDFDRVCCQCMAGKLYIKSGVRLGIGQPKVISV